MREITDSRARNRDELEGKETGQKTQKVTSLPSQLTCANYAQYLGLYRKIVSCVLLRSGLGSPTDIGVVREATGMFIFFLLLTLC